MKTNCNTNIFLLINSIIILNLNIIQAQQADIPIGKYTDEWRDKTGLRVCFYNLENAFDCENDSLKNDDTFTPEGLNHWNYFKFKKKLNNIAKVFIAIGGWEPPEIIGVCEIENEKVIKQLLYYTALKKFNYRYIHYESNDFRGIDVALFYRPDKFKILHSNPIAIIDSSKLSSGTRDILYVMGVLPHQTNDTLHIFVNHWPSRYGGYAASIEKRNFAANVLRAKIDTILNNNNTASILIMGDFNDYPTDESITKYLNASINPRNISEKELLNTIYPYLIMNNVGTHKYQEHWGVLDQIIVSSAMITKNIGWKIKSTAVIFNADFLLIPDEMYLGQKTFRTYTGFRYQGGYSDHLPVFIDIICQ